MKKYLSLLPLILFVFFCQAQNQDTITWYSFNSSFARGNSASPIGSIIGQPLIGNISNGTISIEGGFAADSNVRNAMVYKGPVGVNDDDNFPHVFSLRQNYPNPFNPTTTIRYEIPRRSTVEMIIYNILGQQVISMLNEEKDVGKHVAIWDGRNNVGQQVASGVYFYRVIATPIGKANRDVFVETRRMLLLR